MPATLYIAATPIGNLEDMNIRTIEILKNADLVLCEDTRTSKTLLDTYSINTPMKSLHKHNEISQCNAIIQKLLDNNTVVLISDAGTPVIRDAGKILIEQAHQHNIRVSPLPGACSVTVALSCCGFSADRFVFEGFLPAKPNERRQRLRKLNTEQRTLVLFETPHRLSDTLKDIKEISGNNRGMCLIKELTKIYETIVRGNIDDLIQWTEKDKNFIRGEFIIIFEPKKEEPQSIISIEANELLDLLNDYLSPSAASSIVAKLTKLPRREIYKKNIYKK